MPRQRVSCLYHKPIDNTVKPYAIVIVFTYKFDKIISMLRCVIIKRYGDVTKAGFDNELFGHGKLI